MSRYAFPIATLDKVLGYLGSRPFVEVSDIIREIHQEARKVDDDTPKQVNLPAGPEEDE